MAKVTIVLEDAGDSKVDIDLTHNPPLDLQDPETLTLAQEVGIMMLRTMTLCAKYGSEPVLDVLETLNDDQ